jgi:hypothetical protein
MYNWYNKAFTEDTINAMVNNPKQAPNYLSAQYANIFNDFYKVRVVTRVVRLAGENPQSSNSTVSLVPARKPINILFIINLLSITSLNLFL